MYIRARFIHVFEIKLLYISIWSAYVTKICRKHETGYQLKWNRKIIKTDIKGYRNLFSRWSLSAHADTIYKFVCTRQCVFFCKSSKLRSACINILSLSWASKRVQNKNIFCLSVRQWESVSLSDVSKQGPITFKFSVYYERSKNIRFKVTFDTNSLQYSFRRNSETSMSWMFCKEA